MRESKEETPSGQNLKEAGVPLTSTQGAKCQQSGEPGAGTGQEGCFEAIACVASAKTDTEAVEESHTLEVKPCFFLPDPCSQN